MPSPSPSLHPSLSQSIPCHHHALLTTIPSFPPFPSWRYYINMMRGGVCEQVRGFRFYSLAELEYKQLISRSKYFVGAYQHIDTKISLIVKEIPYSEKSLDVLRRVHKLRNPSIAPLLGVCLYRAEVGWTEAGRVKGGRGEGRQERTLLLFMQRAEMNLLEYVSARRRSIQMFTVQEIRSFVNQMLSVLERLQREGIAHRDIKPENILVYRHNYLLCDFQDAVEVKPGERPSIDLTTVEYSSPQFLRFMRHPKDKYFDPFKLDVYALGLTLLFLCSMGRFSLEERANYIYESSEKSHADFMKDQRSKWVRNQGEYKTFNSLLKMMLEEDEYKRDNFTTLVAKNIARDHDDNSDDYNLSDDNSNSKSNAKLQRLHRKQQRKEARQRRQQQLRRQEVRVYGGLALLLIVLFVLYCLV